ncbi:MAG: 16S rRNA (cytidine(1402)-2'-O)-methyltransferase [Veillonella sp.]|nr:16S rRNA (cytidine(1402)-2'-O)-methyltransferase [Veillonella sp.]
MDKQIGILYLVPTPIGNLEDMTYRAVRILSEVDLVAAEDTRHTGQLLKHFDIKKPLISYHEHNKDRVGPELIDQLLAGKNIAQCSDAGMPAISDPGADLVTLAIEADIPIVPLPGANAGLTALIASGMDTKRFSFVGFLPKRGKHRIACLESLKTQEGTILLYEAPHRLQEVLEDMYKVLGDRPITLARELTKKFEEFIRGDLKDIIEYIDDITYKGEFVILLGGADQAPQGDPDQPQVLLSYEEAVATLVDQGLPKKEAIRKVAKERGVSRREVYNAVEQG